MCNCAHTGTQIWGNVYDHDHEFYDDFGFDHFLKIFVVVARVPFKKNNHFTGNIKLSEISQVLPIFKENN